MTSMRIAPLAATISLSVAVFSIADSAVGKMTGVTIGKDAPEVLGRVDYARTKGSFDLAGQRDAASVM